MPHTPTQPLILYGFTLSGHAHRVELLLRMLGLPFQALEVDLKGGQQKTPEFLAMHPFGQVPVLDDHGTVIWDSAAILTYLCTRYDDGRFLPRDPAGAALVQSWLSVAAGPLAHGPAIARRINLFKRPGDLAGAQAQSRDLLSKIDAYLEGRLFLAADRLTIADLANYSYIAHAPEGGVALEPYTRLSAWLQRVEAAPGFVAMPKSKVGLWA